MIANVPVIQSNPNPNPNTCAELGDSADSTPVICLSLNNKSDFPVTEKDVTGWSELYPAVDVMQELRAMRGWLDANPTKRKTKSGIPRFINAWLSKAQNRGGTAQAAPSPKSGKYPTASDISSADAQQRIKKDMERMERLLGEKAGNG